MNLKNFTITIDHKYLLSEKIQRHLYLKRMKNSLLAIGIDDYSLCKVFKGIRIATKCDVCFS